MTTLKFIGRADYYVPGFPEADLTIVTVPVQPNQITQAQADLLTATGLYAVVPSVTLPPADGHVSTLLVDGKARFAGGMPWYDLAADAACDALIAQDVTCVSGNPQVSSASSQFLQSHVGKIFDLTSGTGPGITGTQFGTILSVQDSQHATLSVAPNANATNAILVWGTDDTAAVNTWAARPGRLRVSAGALCMVTGTVTFPNTKTQVDGGGGSFWVSRRIGATKAFDIGALLAASYLNNFSISAPAGVTGRLIEGVSANEAGTLLLMRDVRVTSLDQSDHDYLVFLKAMVATIDHCSFQNVYPNPLGLKCFAHTAVVSGSESIDCNFIGRVYMNTQTYNIHNSTTGPIALANNSAADGSGTAQQTNTFSLTGSNYIYSASLGGTDYPNIRSVVATANGAGADGGCFPALDIQGGYLVIGSGAQALQYAIRGNFLASQGSVGALCDGVGFVQPTDSVATSLVLVNATNGAPSIYGRGCAGNILASVVSAKIFTNSGGNGDCVWDYMPSGQATPWQHPTISTFIGMPAAMPATATWVRNVGPTAYDMYVTEAVGGAITKCEISPDNGATVVVLWNTSGSVVVPKIVRWPAGTYLRFTYGGGAGTYILVPAP